MIEVCNYFVISSIDTQFFTREVMLRTYDVRIVQFTHRNTRVTKRQSYTFSISFLIKLALSKENLTMIIIIHENTFGKTQLCCDLQTPLDSKANENNKTWLQKILIDLSIFSALVREYIEIQLGANLYYFFCV